MREGSGTQRVRAAVADSSLELQLLADVEGNEKALRFRQDKLEAYLLASPATNWINVPAVGSAGYHW
jgi:hypothetical protein